MAFLGVDLGGTKLCFAVFNTTGDLVRSHKIPIAKREGAAVGALITGEVRKYLSEMREDPIEAIGISVPGICRHKTGTVWAPNIPGWEDYPLLAEVSAVAGHLPVTIECDRACYILGEAWQGNARGTNDAVFLAVGTGIGAGIMVNGTVLCGAHDIAGAIGWMALGRPFVSDYYSCGFFEHHASGSGIAKLAQEQIAATPAYAGLLKNRESLTAVDVFAAYAQNDSIAAGIVGCCIEYWGMAAANLISLLNPEKIIFGGGVFGPAVSLLPKIAEEARKWAQPIAATQVDFQPSALGDKAGVYGAAFLASKRVAAPSVNTIYEA